MIEFIINLIIFHGGKKLIKTVVKQTAISNVSKCICMLYIVISHFQKYSKINKNLLKFQYNLSNFSIVQILIYEFVTSIMKPFCIPYGINHRQTQ